MFHQDIFIFEFVSGGGYNKLEMPSSLFCEGFAMLRTIVEDFKKLGFHITTLLDKRIGHLSRYLNSDIIKYVKNKDDFLKKYKECVRESMLCFIIAPEFSNLLYNLTQIIKNYKKKNLSIDLEGVWLGSSKLETYKYFLANKLKTPKTYKIPLIEGSLDVEFILDKFHKLNKSIVIKPDDGAGSELIFHFKTKDQIIQFVKKFKEKLDMTRSYLLQEFIKGDNLSISVINRSNSKKIKLLDQIILSINSQEIQDLDSNKESLYLGGFTPVKNYEILRDRFKKILKSMDLTSLEGYFGIDFIRKADNSIYFIEINPRLTTSYIGIRNILDYNPLEFIFNQYKSNIEILKLNPKRFSHFSRLELKYSGNDSFKNLVNKVIPNLMKQVPEIVTPPIALQGSKNNQELIYSCFISTKSKDEITSNTRIAQIMTIFSDYNFSVIK